MTPSDPLTLLDPPAIEFLWHTSVATLFAALICDRAHLKRRIARLTESRGQTDGDSSTWESLTDLFSTLTILLWAAAGGLTATNHLYGGPL